MTERACCCVPFCRNTSARFAGGAYLCSTHWPMVSKATRRAHSATYRAWAQTSQDTRERQIAARAYWANWDRAAR